MLPYKPAFDFPIRNSTRIDSKIATFLYKPHTHTVEYGSCASVATEASAHEGAWLLNTHGIEVTVVLVSGTLHNICVRGRERDRKMN